MRDCCERSIWTARERREADGTPPFSNFSVREATEDCLGPFSVDSLALRPYYQTLKKGYLPSNVACEGKR